MYTDAIDDTPLIFYLTESKKIDPDMFAMYLKHPNAIDQGGDIQRLISTLVRRYRLILC